MKKSVYRVVSLICIVLILLGTLTSCEDSKESKESMNVKENIKVNQNDIFMQDSSSIKLGLRFDSNFRYKDVLSEIEAETSNDLRFKFDFKIFQTRTDVSTGTVLPYDKAVSLLETYDAINTAGNFVKLASEGKLMDITDLLPQYAPKYFAKLTETELDLVTYNGRIYGIPPHMPGLGRHCIKVRKDIADKYRITEINTLEDFGRLLSMINKDSPDTIPTDWSYFEWMANTDTETNAFIDTYGYVSIGNDSYMVYKADDPHMKLIPWEDTESFSDLASMIPDWDKKDLMSRAWLTNPPVEITTLYKFIFSYRSADQDQLNIYPLTPEIPSILYRSNENIISISAKSENAINVLRFIEWVHSSQENYDLFMYGIKGKDYVLAGDRLKKLGNGYEGDPSFWDIDYMRLQSHEADNLMDQIKNISKLEEIVPPTYGQDFSDIVKKIEAASSKRDSTIDCLLLSRFDYKEYKYRMGGLENGMEFHEALASCNTGKLKEALQEAVDRLKKE